ncbi:MAG: phage late control D family protein [Rudaea sp.]
MPGHPQYAPIYRLAINGQEIPTALRSCVTSVRYEDGMQGADQVQISLANPELRFLQQHIRGLAAFALPSAVGLNSFARVEAVPAGLFDLDNQVVLALGYAPDPPVEMFLGEITAVGASFPNGGMPTLTVTAHDFLQRTTRGSVSRGFGPLPDAAIIAILSVENGLLPLIDPYMIPLDVLNTIGNFLFGTSTQQSAQSDFELLSQIARRYDMDLYVDHHTLYLSRFMKEFSPRMTLTYGKSLLDFTPRVSTVGQAVGVSMRVALREIRVDLILNVFWDLDRESIGITVLPAQAAVIAPAVSKPVQESKHKTIRNAIDVANQVVGLVHELRQKINNRLTGSGTAIGDPQIRAGAMLRLDGLGVDFSGNYRVTKATHTLDTNGYRTAFEVQREIIP